MLTEYQQLWLALGNTILAFGFGVFWVLGRIQLWEKAVNKNFEVLFRITGKLLDLQDEMENRNG